MKLEDLPDEMCPWCGGEIPRDKPHSGKRIYCSDACSQAYRHQLEKDARLQARTGRACQWCKGPISEDKPADVTKFCSPECRHENRRFNTWGYRTCEICEEKFIPSSQYAKRCGIDIMACVNRLKARLREAERRAG